jgi:crotonobetainyl-CoA:carnitine CoA-transferase CaiB-like acyl-CoA transferase
MTGVVPQRIGSKHPNIAPYGELFDTKDGATITFAIGSDTHFKKLCNVIGEDALAEDKRFESNQLRVENRGILYDLLNQCIHMMDSKELLTKLEQLNVPAGKVKDLEEVFESDMAKVLLRDENIDGIKTQRVSSVIFKWNGNTST